MLIDGLASLSRRQRRRARGKPSDGLDRDHRPDHDLFATSSGAQLLELGKLAAFTEVERTQ